MRGERRARRDAHELRKPPRSFELSVVKVSLTNLPTARCEHGANRATGHDGRVLLGDRRIDVRRVRDHGEGPADPGIVLSTVKIRDTEAGVFGQYLDPVTAEPGGDALAVQELARRPLGRGKPLSGRGEDGN